MQSEQEEFFKDESKAKPVSVQTSPSGKYRLGVHNFATKPGCWDYTRGKFYRGDTLLFEVKRNYSSFPICWIEAHPNGHDYAITGSDYQGQTILELDTGKCLDTRSPGADKGHGFCWIEPSFDYESQVLTVEGCVWACPGEFRFFDFRDPMNGFPQLETAEIIDANPHVKPVHQPDGTILCRRTRTIDRTGDNDWDIEPGDDEPTLHSETEGDYQERDILVETVTLRREEGRLNAIDRWISSSEKKRREESERAHKAWEEEWKKYQAEDPLFLELKKVDDDKFFVPQNYVSIGRTFQDDWKASGFTLNESTVNKRLLDNKKYAIDISIARFTGPVRLQVWFKATTFKKAHDEVKFFPHSPERVREALAYAKSVCR